MGIRDDQARLGALQNIRRNALQASVANTLNPALANAPAGLGAVQRGGALPPGLSAQVMANAASQPMPPPGAPPPPNVAPPVPPDLAATAGQSAPPPIGTDPAAPYRATVANAFRNAMGAGPSGLDAALAQGNASLPAANAAAQQLIAQQSQQPAMPPPPVAPPPAPPQGMPPPMPGLGLRERLRGLTAGIAGGAGAAAGLAGRQRLAQRLAMARGGR